MRKHRFLLYAAIGVLFGIADWYYLNWLAHFPWGSLGESILVVPIILAMNYGIWLVPILPVTILEARQANKIIHPILAGMLTWSCAILSYYAFYAILLSLGKLVNLEHLNVFGEKTASFWQEYWQMFDRIITGQLIEWIIVAIMGGAIVGVISFWLFRNKESRKVR